MMSDKFQIETLEAEITKQDVVIDNLKAEIETLKADHEDTLNANRYLNRKVQLLVMAYNALYASNTVLADYNRHATMSYHDYAKSLKQNDDDQIKCDHSLDTVESE